MHGTFNIRTWLAFFVLECAWTGVTRLTSQVEALGWFVVSAALLIGAIAWDNRARFRVWLTRVEPLHLIVVGIAGLFIFAGVAILGAFLLLRPPPAQTKTVSAQAVEAGQPATSNPPAQLPDENRPYTRQFGALPPTSERPARIEALFRRSGQNAKFYIELSYYIGPRWEDWSPKTRRVFIGSIADFVDGEVKHVPLFVKHTKDGQDYWTWGPDDTAKYAPNIWYRGRVTVFFPDGNMEKSYFVLPPIIASVQPILFEHFAFREQWEAEDARP